MNDERVRDVPAEDAEGHRFVPVDERPAVGEAPATAPSTTVDDEDTEGHRRTI